MPTKQIVLDSNVLVALISGRDSLHAKAEMLIRACQSAEIELVYLDCVLSETLSVLGRRAEEQNRSDEFPTLVDNLESHVPITSIVWLTELSRRYYPGIVALMRQSRGELNFNDCLIALGCHELGLATIISFDADFDSVTWLHRVSGPNSPLLRQNTL
jgi:predicted nucleic acid-binding protein